MRDNGLTAPAYTSMGGIDPLVTTPVLAALAEAGIAAYCAPPGAAGPAAVEAKDTDSTAASPASASAASVADEPTDADAATPTAAETQEVADASATAESAEPADGSKKTADGSKKTADGSKRTLPAGFEEIFVDTEAVERARAVIDRSTEDAEWKSLVEQFNAPSAPGHDATPVPRWPASEDVDESSYEPLVDVPAGLIVDDTDEEPPEEPPARRKDDPHDHFVPPEPPRGPRLDWISRAAWLGLIGGPLLLIAAAVLDFGTGRITLLAVVGFVAGFLTLVIRMGDRLPPDDTPDDGAVV